MRLESIAITGAEQTGDKNSPYAALVEFYRAFNQQDLRLMTANWIDSDEASMSNPLGGVKRSWPEIEGVYKKLFNDHAQVYVEFYDYTIHQAGDMFCAVGRERGHFILGDKRIELAIRTTRIYRRGGNRWQQLHHHGSIDNPDVLSRYQSAVLMA